MHTQRSFCRLCTQTHTHTHTPPVFFPRMPCLHAICLCAWRGVGWRPERNLCFVNLPVVLFLRRPFSACQPAFLSARLTLSLSVCVSLCPVVDCSHDGVQRELHQLCVRDRGVADIRRHHQSTHLSNSHRRDRLPEPPGQFCRSARTARLIGTHLALPGVAPLDVVELDLLLGRRHGAAALLNDLVPHPRWGQDRVVTKLALQQLDALLEEHRCPLQHADGSVGLRLVVVVEGDDLADVRRP
mmetsp:Transcript_36690/g.105146  ORF Transcript_36690/g.105146 Transcript_36690/m.105146 type:complete len:242 (-) Transcript_36690:191-916(-)